MADELESRALQRRQDDEEFLNLLQMEGADDEDEVDEEPYIEERMAGTDELMDAMLENVESGGDDYEKKHS